MKSEPRYIGSEFVTRMLARVARAGFQHNPLVKSLWSSIWRLLVERSGLPDLPLEESLDEEVVLEEIEKDIVIIGSEPGAIILANELSSHRGLDVLLVYRGSVAYKDYDVRIDSSVERLENGAYLGFFEDGYLFVDRSRRRLYKAKKINKIIFSEGTRETYPIFENNDLPGIISSDLFLRLLEECSLKNKKIIVLSYGWWGRYVASQALRAGAETTVLTPEESLEKTDYEVVSGVVEVVGVGYPVIRGLKYVSKRSRGFVRADLVVSALHRQPNIESMLQLGAEPAYTEYLEAITINVREDGSVDKLNVIGFGEMTGTPRNYLVQEAELISRLVRGSSLSENEKDLLRKIYYEKKIVDLRNKIISKKPSFYLAKENNIDGLKFTCLCEDVLLRDVVDAYERGYETLEKIKRYTALGTGVCQGRLCKYASAMLLSYLERVPLGSIGLIRQRPPLEPVEIRLL